MKYPKNYSVYNDYPDNKVIFIGDNGTHRSPTNGITFRIIYKAIEEAIYDLENRDKLTEVIEERNIMIDNISIRKIVATSAIGYNEAHYYYSKNDINYEIIWEYNNTVQADILASLKLIN